MKTKLAREMTEFRNSYMHMTPKEVYENYYIIGFYEEFYNLLNNSMIEDDCPALIEWLNQFANPITFLWGEWLSCDIEFSYNWDEMINWLTELYKEMK